MIRYNPNFMTAEQAKQLIDSINAFKRGEAQPTGRFEIKGDLSKGSDEK